MRVSFTRESHCHIHAVFPCDRVSSMQKVSEEDEGVDGKVDLTLATLFDTR